MVLNEQSEVLCTIELNEESGSGPSNYPGLLDKLIEAIDTIQEIELNETYYKPGYISYSESKDHQNWTLSKPKIITCVHNRAHIFILV